MKRKAHHPIPLTTHPPVFILRSPMPTAAPTPPQPAAPTGAAAADWARALLERQLWILGQLAEGGLEIARAIERQATGAGSDDAAPHTVDAHIPMAYARVARAVRMTILLQSRLIADLQALEARTAQAADAALGAKYQRALERPRLENAQKARLGRIVGRIAWADGQDDGKADRMEREAVERLEEDERYGDLLTRPFSEIIALLCQDMELEPDWPRLAGEAWARAEIESGAVGGPWATWPSEISALGRPAANDPAPLKPQAASP